MIDPRRKQAIKDTLAAFGLAVAVHLGFVLILVVGTWNWEPFEHKPVPVRVTLVDQGPTAVEQPEAVEDAVDAAERERQRQAELEQQRREEEAERERQAELERQRAEEQAEQQRQEQLEQQRREEEQRRQAEAERRRREDEQARQQAEEEQRQLERERREREAARQRELEELRRQREEAQREREEQQRRLDELAERRERDDEKQAAKEQAERLRLAQEQAAADARRATLREEYIATLRELVRRSWIRPPTAQPGVRCNVRVLQAPNGGIIDATIVSPCNAGEATRRSIIAAVNRVGQFPTQGYEDVFERQITFEFSYDG